MAAGGQFTGSRAHSNKMLPTNASQNDRNQIWSEHVAKELKHNQLRYQFTANPKSSESLGFSSWKEFTVQCLVCVVTVLPENINRMKRHEDFRHNPYESPKKATSRSVDDWKEKMTTKAQDDKMLRMLADGAQSPQKKHPYAMTSNMVSESLAGC